MPRIRSRSVETESVNQRMLRRGAVKRQHISQWAIGHDELAPGVVGGTHLHPSTHEIIREIVNDGSAGAGQVLTLSATGVLVASGGDYVSFDSIVAQTGFAEVTEAGESWVHPVAAVYVLEYEHAWDGYDGGGRIELELDGVVPAVGVIAQGTAGRRGRGTIVYYATAGAVGKIKATQVSGGAEYANAVVRIGLSDQSDGVTAIPLWTQLFAADTWDITNDGSSWWTTAGLSSANVTERSPDGSVLSAFSAADVSTPRGITFDGTDLWVHGALDGEVAKYSTAGVLLDSFNYYPAWAEQTGAGIAWDGTDLWLVGRDTKQFRRYSTAGVHAQTISLAGMTTPQGAAEHGGRLYVVDGGTAHLWVFTLAGAHVDTVDVSTSGSSAFGVWISDDGTIYMSADDDGVYRREVQL